MLEVLVIKEYIAFNGVVTLNGVLVKSRILLTLHSDSTLPPWENEAIPVISWHVLQFHRFSQKFKTVVLL